MTEGLQEMKTREVRMEQMTRKRVGRDGLCQRVRLLACLSHEAKAGERMTYKEGLEMNRKEEGLDD